MCTCECFSYDYSVLAPHDAGQHTYMTSVIMYIYMTSITVVPTVGEFIAGDYR